MLDCRKKGPLLRAAQFGEELRANRGKIRGAHRLHQMIINNRLMTIRAAASAAAEIRSGRNNR
jgi:hypothetical protein